MPFKLINPPKKAFETEAHEVPYEMRRERLGTQMTREELQEVSRAYGSKGQREERLFHAIARGAQPTGNPHADIEALGRELGLLPVVQGTAAAVYDSIAPKREVAEIRVTNRLLSAYAVLTAIRRHGLNIRTNAVLEAARHLGWRVSLSGIIQLQLEFPVPHESQTAEDLQSVILKGLVKEGYISPQEYGPLLEEGRVIARDRRLEGKTPQSIAAASVWRVLQRKAGGRRHGPVPQEVVARLAGISEYVVRETVGQLRLAGYETAYERDTRDIKKQTSLEGFIAPLESYGPPVVEEKKPFVPVKYVDPLYRLGEELRKRGYTRQRSKDLWRYGPPRGKFAEVIPWEGDAFVKRQGESFARVWLAPFGDLTPQGLPVTGKWGGYMYILPERLKISSGVQDSQDQAVDALLETEARNWGVTKEAFRERAQKELEERQRQEFMAKYPTEESARIHDMNLIKPMTLRLSPAVETAINRILGEYVSRELNEARKLGTHGSGRGVPITARRIDHPFYHYDQKDLDDFLERYDADIREEAKKIGPWGGQKAEPMGSWKEKWRPFVKSKFKEWFRVHYH